MSASKEMTVGKVPLWAEGEGHNGVPVLMSSASIASSPERLAHVRTRLSAVTALQEALKRAGLSGEAFTSGVTVEIDAGTAFEPDASVVCGPRRSDDAIVVSDPVIVVEVLSPSTAGIDHGLKLSGYLSIPSLQHYLILDPDRRVVIHHKRKTCDAIETRVLTGGAARLDPPGFEVAVEALFPPL